MRRRPRVCSTLNWGFLQECGFCSPRMFHLTYFEKFSPFGVDVATGIESKPGRKDPELLKLFIENAKSTKARSKQ